MTATAAELTFLPTQPEGGWAFHTPNLDEWSAAFVALAADLEDITRDRRAEVKTKTGGSYSYSYADLATIMTDLRPKAAAQGLAISQAVEKDSTGSVLVWTTLIHRSGQRVTWQPLTMPGGSTPQDAGSAITYARRYAVLACLGIATEDDDGAQAGKAVREARERPRANGQSSSTETAISAIDAKGRLLSLAGGDKEAAAAAWDKAGLTNRHSVTGDELTAAVRELHELGWSWAPNSTVNDAGGSPDSDDAGRANMTTPPASPTLRRQPPPVGLNARQVAIKAGVVFKADYDAAPRGDKTKTADRLRHALVYTQTGGRTTSLSDCRPPEIHQVWYRLEDITDGRLTYSAKLGDDGGVTWETQDGERTTVMWTEIEPEGQPGAGAELPDGQDT